MVSEAGEKKGDGSGPAGSEEKAPELAQEFVASRNLTYGLSSNRLVELGGSERSRRATRTRS